jgi:hypothetical protein
LRLRLCPPEGELPPSLVVLSYFTDYRRLRQLLKDPPWHLGMARTYIEHFMLAIYGRLRYNHRRCLPKALRLRSLTLLRRSLAWMPRRPWPSCVFFFDLKDPRRHNVRHLFTDILTIALLGLLCRNEDFDEIVL